MQTANSWDSTWTLPLSIGTCKLVQRERERGLFVALFPIVRGFAWIPDLEQEKNLENCCQTLEHCQDDKVLHLFRRIMYHEVNLLVLLVFFLNKAKSSEFLRA